MKKLIPIISLILTLLLTVSGCVSTPPVDTVPPADGTTEAPDIPTEAPTDIPTEGDTLPTEPSPEPSLGDRMDAVPLLLAADGTHVSLTYRVDVRESAVNAYLRLVLSDKNGVIETGDHPVNPTQSANPTAQLTCPADRIMGELTLTGTLTADGEGGEILDEFTLRMKNGLPQLTTDGVYCVLNALSNEEKAHMVTGVQNPVKSGASGGTYPIDRLGVPSVTVNDGPAGVRYGKSIWYPSVSNISASWDPALAERVGAAMADDALALGIDVILAPGMNLQKNVLCGRNFEYSSEDPLLTALMCTPYVQGMQSAGVGVSVKHFAANNQESARGSVSANVTERALREMYLKAFAVVIRDSDPWTVMSSYNLINGVRNAINPELLNGILREEMGFSGMVMSDWGSGGSVVEKVMAGNDINMPGNATDPADVLKALENGTLTELALNAACYNILSMVAKSPTCKGLDMNHRVNTKTNAPLSGEAAADTMILLQNNDSALPMAENATVAVFGNGAYQTVYGGAGSGSVSPTDTVNIMQGLRKCGTINVVNSKNNPFEHCEPHSAADPSKDIPVSQSYAKEMATAADYAVVVISRGSAEGEDRSTRKGDFLLSDTEAEMMTNVSEAFRAQGKKVVVILNMGAPMEIISWRDKADAILYCGYAGQRTGTAVANVLTGAVNPSAKTTVTWPTTYASTPAAKYFPGSSSDVLYYEDIYVGYRYYHTFGVDVAYPFGYGLSYTTFAYENINSQQREDGRLTVWVTVKNTGSVAGREIVQLYVSKPENLQEQAKVELCGFAKTKLLAPGESERICITASMDALMTYDTADSRWVLDQGDYVYAIGPSSADLRTVATVKMDKLTVIQDVENRVAPKAELTYIQKDTYTVPDGSDQDTDLNLALGKATQTNFTEGQHVAANAVDGDPITRWSGLGLSSGSHYWQVDLGKIYAIGQIEIRWESIHVPFTLLVSDDGKTFTQQKMYQDGGSGITLLNLYGLKTRFIRLDISRGSAVSIYEFCAYEATAEDIAAGEAAGARQNLAQGKTVTATTHEAAYVKDNAVDGDLTTRWGSLPTGSAWLQVDLGDTKKVDGIEVYLESAWVPYRVEYSTDGKNYTTLKSCAKDELMLVLEDLNITARYIRLTREGENWFSIYELAVYGE